MKVLKLLIVLVGDLMLAQVVAKELPVVRHVALALVVEHPAHVFVIHSDLLDPLLLDRGLARGHLRPLQAARAADVSVRLASSGLNCVEI